MTEEKKHHIHLITGHYGSGKTEFALNYALYLKKRYDKVALIDLDIVNLYFRSREYADMLNANGIVVHGSSIEGNQVDIPALAASISGPLDDAETQVVVDVGGNDVGARVLGYYRKLIERHGADHLFVVNRNRPETADLATIGPLMQEIANLAHVPVSGLINCTHLLKSTTAKDVLYGQELCEEISQKYDIPIRYVACRSNVCDSLPDNLQGEIFPMEIFMRLNWMK